MAFDHEPKARIAFGRKRFSFHIIHYQKGNKDSLRKKGYRNSAPGVILLQIAPFFRGVLFSLILWFYLSKVVCRKKSIGVHFGTILAPFRVSGTVLNLFRVKTVSLGQWGTKTVTIGEPNNVLQE